jgi:hypothetical protein
MHPNTTTALQLLARSLALHPEDAADLMAYGRLPEHLADAIEDLADLGDAQQEPGEA